MLTEEKPETFEFSMATTYGCGSLTALVQILNKTGKLFDYNMLLKSWEALSKVIADDVHGSYGSPTPDSPSAGPVQLSGQLSGDGEYAQFTWTYLIMALS